ncbi:MAG: hypothetical protein BJ554DRAFT_2868 [Olpidium bornovanus]|uniref:Uncharacterized protein n=1 Tax=Olpidium bornovanus TaxID=278681 RepID=A0A8H7ZQB8_9FUNG|nr:MAG: hypothetical protein BJ554DRAFT_2868 [Olpidium bornovanus]
MATTSTGQALGDGGLPAVARMMRCLHFRQVYSRCGGSLESNVRRVTALEGKEGKTKLPRRPSFFYVVITTTTFVVAR